MTVFKGFQAPTHHTQVPNEFFDEILLVKGVTLSEVKILGFMIRYTFGWQRAGNTLPLTFTEIMNATKQAREAVNNGLKKCLDKGYIQRKEIKEGRFLYRLKIADFEDYPWELSFSWQSVHPDREEISNVKKPEKISNSNVQTQEFDNRTECSSEIEPSAVRKSNRVQFGNRTDMKVESLKALSENVPLNKGLNKRLNKDLNKENLSIQDEIKELNLPIPIYQILEKKIDRLKSSYLPVILLKFNSYKDLLSPEKFADILNTVLSQEIKSSFTNYLDKSINMYITNLSKLISNTHKPIRTEMLPDFLTNESAATSETGMDYFSMDRNELLETKKLFEELGQVVPGELVNALENKR